MRSSRSLSPTTWRYLPILKWNRAEQDALLHVTSKHRRGITPLIEVQRSRGVSLDTTAAITAHHIERCVSPETSVALETRYLLDGLPKTAELMTLFCTRLQGMLERHRVIPVIHSSLLDTLIPGTQRSRSLLKRFPEVILRLRSDLIASDRIAPIVDLVRGLGIKPSRIHLLIDQFSLVGRDPASCATDVRPYLISALSQSCASVSLAGGSFPLSLTGYRSGVHDIPRIEWRTWRRLRRKGQFSEVRFSDYGVTNPSPEEVAEVPPHPPHIAIRYAADDFWRLYQGGRVKGGAQIAFNGLCRTLVSDAVFSDADTGTREGLFEPVEHFPSSLSSVSWQCRRDSMARHLALITHSL